MSISLTGSGPSIELTGSGSSITLTVTTGGGSSGGVTDHGLLTGLSDDDHTQYHNDARGDARYLQQSNDLSDLASAAAARTNLGLGDSATLDVGTGSGDVAAGDAPASAVSTHNDATTSVHGIVDTSAIATGPASATDSAIALFDGTGGKTLKDSAVTISTDDTLASDSDAKVPTEQAVKAYVDANAGGGGGLWEEVSETTLGSDQASVSFTGLDAYEEVQILWEGQNNNAGASYSFLLATVNSDGGANYHYAVAGRSGSSNRLQDASNATAGYVGMITGAQSSGDARWSAGVVTVRCQQPTARAKTLEGRSWGGATGEAGVLHAAVVWNNTANAISSVQLFCSSGDFVAGSKFTVLGRA